MLVTHKTIGERSPHAVASALKVDCDVVAASLNAAATSFWRLNLSRCFGDTQAATLI
jgi:hypothetical protein